MYDPNILIQAGIDPKTGLPIKLDNTIGCISKSEIKKQLRILDEQNAVNRFAWYNLPNGLNAKLIERILYYKGQGMFFYMKENDKFYFLPYALDGTIDVYGRFTGVTPLPFNGVTGGKNKEDKETPWISGLIKKPVYDIKLDKLTIEDIEDNCVLLKDYTEQISQTNISRQLLQDPILDVMSEMFPFMRTALLNGTGIQGMRVNTQDEYANVEAASRSVNRAALEGKKWIPVVGNVEFQEMTGGSVAKAEEFLLAMQSLDNYRLSLYGLQNGGLFQKKSHMLQSEQDMNQGNVDLVMRDSLQCRQDFCDIVNSIWNLGIWCEPSDAAVKSNNGMEIDSDEDTEDKEEDVQEVSENNDGGED